MPHDPLFSCRYCGKPEKHDRRGCAGAKTLADLHSRPEWVAQMKERNRAWLKEKWAKVQQAERNAK